jgi:HEAT repeat protein
MMGFNRMTAGFSTRRRGIALVLAAACTGAAVGCASLPSPDLVAKAHEESETCIERGMRFPLDPAVRAQAMEAAGRVLGEKGRLRLREGLKDQHPGVRFAACMALGKLRDDGAATAVKALVADKDPSVRVGAYFALDQIGDGSYRREWIRLLRSPQSPEVRRNAVLALGQLKNKDAAPLLRASSTTDPDDGVRTQALEGLALLGERDAINRFTFEAFGGVGFKQAFAILTLGQVSDDRVLPALRSRLANSPYVEARLAAARGLGSHGFADGFKLALASLDWNEPNLALPDDPPETQIMRVRSMAAMALGEIGDQRALVRLKKVMENPDDPRVQLAAATAILMILDHSTSGAGKWVR